MTGVTRVLEIVGDRLTRNRRSDQSRSPPITSDRIRSGESNCAIRRFFRGSGMIVDVCFEES
jgi:hypothetical protein